MISTRYTQLQEPRFPPGSAIQSLIASMCHAHASVQSHEHSETYYDSLDGNNVDKYVSATRILAGV